MRALNSFNAPNVLCSSTASTSHPHLSSSGPPSSMLSSSVPPLLLWAPQKRSAIRAGWEPTSQVDRGTTAAGSWQQGRHNPHAACANYHPCLAAPQWHRTVRTVLPHPGRRQRQSWRCTSHPHPHTASWHPSQTYRSRTRGALCSQVRPTLHRVVCWLP